MAKSFLDWTKYDLEQTFGLVKKEAESCGILNDWLDVSSQIQEPAIQKELDSLIVDLTEYADEWNEEELKGFFVMPFLRLVDFRSKKYKLFFERQLVVKRNGVDLRGNVDAMIASGSYSKIVAPFFCMQEYKPESRKSANDVRGQLLAEMLAAQTLNKDEIPIYGSYLNGRMWFFATLVGTDYCFSKSYVADDKKDLALIFNTLKKLKTLIEAKI